MTSSWWSRAAAGSLAAAFHLCSTGRAWGADVGTEPVAGARAELAVGVAPVTYGGRPEPGTMITFAPVIGWRVAARRWSLVLAYAPRIRRRYPNRLELSRPLLWHAANARYTEVFSRKVQLTGGLDWQHGELDYLGVPELLGESQTSSPQATVLRFTQIGATGGVSHKYNRRHQQEIGAGAGRRWLASEGAATFYPTTTNLGINIVERYVAGRRDNLDLTLLVGTAFFDWSRESDIHYLRNSRPMVLSDPRPGLQRYDSGSVRGHWQRRLGNRSTMDLGAGVTGAIRNEGPVSWYPSAQFGLSGPLNRDRQVHVTGDASLTVDAILDRLYGGYRPIIGAGSGVTVIHPERWTLALRLSATTAATLEPIGNGRPETLLRADIPLTLPLGSQTTLELGARAGSRGSHWAAHPFRMTEKYAWLYAAINWASRSRLGR